MTRLATTIALGFIDFPSDLEAAFIDKRPYSENIGSDVIDDWASEKQAKEFSFHF